MNNVSFKVNQEDPILITGGSGFIGVRVVYNLLQKGFKNIRCFVRETSDLARLQEAIKGYESAKIEIVKGTLLSREDCGKAVKDAVVIYHLAASTSTKAFSDAFLHSVVTTRNIMDAALDNKCLKRFVNISSFAVYTNRNKPKWRLLDERCPVEPHPESRAQAYCYGKVKQDELVIEYGKNNEIPYVILRPGTVYGPGKNAIPGRVGVDTFGFFLHLGGSNPIPFTYVDNCAEAIVLAGLTPGIENEVFNIVDDQPLTSRRFLRLYKRYVKTFRTFYVPHGISYLFCVFWEYFSKWSKGQLPASYTRREWAANWKKTRYSNKKLKALLGWAPRVTIEEGMNEFVKYCKNDKDKV
jgi:nucleoside-diphosphate-sugar epimerase